jgi:hypothetical protein
MQHCFWVFSSFYLLGALESKSHPIPFRKVGLIHTPLLNKQKDFALSTSMDIPD